MRQQVEMKKFEAWPVFVDEFFEQTDNGYVLRQDHDEMLRDVMEEARQIESELANDDF